MFTIDSPDGMAFAIHCPAFCETDNCIEQSGKKYVRIGIKLQKIRFLEATGQSIKAAQFYGIVRPGLMYAKYAFRGLRRGMHDGANPEAAKTRLAVSWAHDKDVWFAPESRRPPRLEYGPAPARRTFVVYISVNEMLGTFPSIYGWAEHWTWVASDPLDSDKPVEWDTRFDAQIWPSAGSDNGDSR